MKLRTVSLLLLGALVGVGLAGGSWILLKRRAKFENTYALSDDILVQGNPNLKEIAFTFDDGPTPENTRALLNILGANGVRATFFVVGKQVELHPMVIRRMMNEGHEVGNHTFNHPRLDGMPLDEIRKEIVACDKAILKATGARTNLFRPPGMRYDDVVLRASQDLNYVTVHWNVAAHDYASQEPSDIVEKVIRNAQPGSVVLLHGHPDTVKALPTILSKLKANGYRFVTVSQMLARLPRPVIVRSNAFGATNLVAQKAPPRASRKQNSHVAKVITPEPSISSPSRVRGYDTPVWN